MAVLAVVFGTLTMGMLTTNVAGADAPAAVYVSPTGSDSNAGTIGAPFATIQHAIDSVASGGSVTVAAGTYDESLTIDKPVTLDGARSGVDARTRSGAESVITGSDGVVYTAGATTGTIDGFTLQGYTGSTSEITASDVGSAWDFSNDVIDVSYGGIYLNTDGVPDPATTTINHDSFVQAIPSSASSGYFGGAVNLWSQASNAADNVTVSNNSFTNLSGPTGAVHTGSNPSCSSTGPGTDPADYAKSLTVSGNSFTDTGNDENFLVAFCTSGATVTGNTVTVNDPGDYDNASTGMYLGGGNYGLDLSSNTLTAVGLPAGAISLNSIFNPGGTGDVISGNTITGWTKGVQVAGGQSPAPTGFSVTNNSVSGASTYGVEVLTYEGAQPTGGTLSGNTASGSGTDDCYDNTTGAGTLATGNTWTGNTGTTSSPAGLCQLPAVAPAITSANGLSIYQGTSGNTFTVTATGTPAPTLVESGALPSGVTFNPGTGVLSGSTHVTGSFPITFTATNVAGSTSQAFTLTVLAAAPAFTSSNHATFVVGQLGTADVTVTGAPTPTVTAAGALPAGVTLVSVGPGHYRLTGTPGAGTGKVYSVKFYATSTSGHVKQVVTLTVDQAPAITSVNSKSGTVGSAFSFTLRATGYPKPTFSSASLPPGVTITNIGNGKATLAGHFLVGQQTFTITATDGNSPDATQSFTLVGH